MAFTVQWTAAAAAEYERLRIDAEASVQARKRGSKIKAAKCEGLFKQVHGCIQKLLADPRHPGLRSHKFSSLEHPYDPKQPVFEAYIQNRTPGAYRLFWCYGPATDEITLIAIMPHA